MGEEPKVSIYDKLVQEWPTIRQANLPAVHVPEHRRPIWLVRLWRRARG